MFPSRDAIDAADDVLQLERISAVIISAFPELADAVLRDERKLLLTIPYPAGGYVVIARMTRHRVLRWVVAVPDTPGPTIHEPSSFDDYPRLVGEALGLERAA